MRTKIILIKYVWSIIIRNFHSFLSSFHFDLRSKKYFYVWKFYDVSARRNNTRKLLDLHSVKPRHAFYIHFVLCIKFLFFIFSYSATDFLAFHSNKKWYRNPYPSFFSLACFRLQTHTNERRGNFFCAEKSFYELRSLSTYLGSFGA